MTGRRKVAFVTEHERFWLDVIRTASRGTDPTPTLKRTQQLRRLFEEERPFEADSHGRGGGLAALPARGVGDSATVNPGSSTAGEAYTPVGAGSGGIDTDDA